MVSDRQVKRLWQLAQKLAVETAAAKAGMDSKTARKYLRDRRLPSEMRQKHTWRTRPDPFADSSEEIRELLNAEPDLQAKTLFEHLQSVRSTGDVDLNLDGCHCGRCGSKVESSCKLPGKATTGVTGSKHLGIWAFLAGNRFRRKIARRNSSRVRQTYE